MRRQPWLMTRIVRLFKSGRFNDLIKGWEGEELTQKTSYNLRDRFLIAASLFKLSRYEDCEQICLDLFDDLKLNPNFIALYGAVLRRLNKSYLAFNLFTGAIKQGINDPALSNNFANLLIDNGKLQEAKKILYSLKAQNPFNIKDVEANILRLNQLILNKQSNKNNIELKIFQEVFGSNKDEKPSINSIPIQANKVKVKPINGNQDLLPSPVLQIKPHLDKQG